MTTRNASRRLGLAAAALLALVAITGCSGSTAATPDIQGTWTGVARFASPDGSVITSDEKLTITKQDGALVWGTFTYKEINGSDTQTGVTGTLLSDGKGIALTEPESHSSGTVEGSTMKLTVTFASGAENHSAFEMTLTKQP